MRVLQGNPPWAYLRIRHELLRPIPPWFNQQLGRLVGNPPYHPDGPPWLAGLGLRRWYTYLVYPQQSKLGDAPEAPFLHRQKSGHLSTHYIFIVSYSMCFSWSIFTFAFSFLLFCLLQ
jgi:hypothetical protein